MGKKYNLLKILSHILHYIFLGHVQKLACIKLLSILLLGGGCHYIFIFGIRKKRGVPGKINV